MGVVYISLKPTDPTLRLPLVFSSICTNAADYVGNFCRPFLIFDPSTFTTAWFNTSPTPFYTKKKLLFKEKVTLINVVKIDTLKSNVILKRNDD